MLRSVAIALSASLAIAASLARADDYAERARAVAADHGTPVVTVEMTIEMTMSMTGMGTERNEETMNAAGIVVHPDGWVLLTNTSVDPASQYAGMLSMMPDGVRIESRVTSARIRYADGSEAEAQVVLRDSDMDLALAKPVEVPSEPRDFVDFSEAAAVAMFDPVVILQRLGRVARYELSGFTARIEAVIERPRLLYVMTGPAGTPVFTLQGAPVGILGQRSFGGGAMSFSDFDSNFMSVIVPGVDIVEFLAEGADATTPEDNGAVDDE